jgi:hypothetical protein
MKFSVPIAELQKHFGNVGSVIPTRSTLPILENFLFEVTGNKLKIVATDLDTAISVSVAVKGTKDGKMAIPAKRLMDTVRALPPGNITFAGDGVANKISLVTDNGEYKLTGESSDNFPTVPEVKGDTEFMVREDVLRRLVNTTSFAVSNDELRPAMTGIYFQMTGKEVRAVSTDGHRLIRIIHTGINTGKVKSRARRQARALHVRHDVHHDAADRGEIPELRKRHPERQQQGIEAQHGGVPLVHPEDVPLRKQRDAPGEAVALEELAGRVGGGRGLRQ